MSEAAIERHSPSVENINNYAKILITPVLYRGTNQSNICNGAFLQKLLTASQMFDRVINTPLNSKRVLWGCGYLANSSSLITQHYHNVTRFI